MKDLKATVLSNEAIAENIYEITLRLPEMVESSGGQFVNLSTGNSALPLRRPLGICKAEGDKITLCYQIKGRGTKSLKEAKVGDMLGVMLPLGNGFDLKNYKKVAVIGGGVGVFPLIYTIECCADKVDFYSYIGFRNSACACFIDELKRSKELVLVSDDGSIGEKNNAVNAFFASGNYADFDAIIACGPPAMLRALKHKYTELRMKTPCFVSLEERMGCGVGACLVCVCKKSDGENARVCKDGPVFDIMEVEL